MNYDNRKYATLEKALPVMAGLAALASTAKADPIVDMTFVSNTQNSGSIYDLTYTITNMLPAGSSYSVDQFTQIIGGYQTGTAALDRSGWSIFSETPWDTNGDSIFDGYAITMKASNPVAYLPSTGTNFMNFSVQYDQSLAPTFLNQQVNYSTQGSGSFSQAESSPAAAIPEPGTTAALLGVAALGAIAAKRYGHKMSGLVSKLFK